jgi:membrane fusion protein (multidrug efflux system)
VNYTDIRVNVQTGTSEARAMLPNPGGQLRAGEFVRVELHGAMRPGAIVVPQRAVMESPKGKYVYIVDAESKSQIRPVEAGDWTGDGWIINSGIQPGDRVVVEGVVKLSLMPPGVPVQVSDGAPPADGKGAPAAKKPVPEKKT